MGLDSVEMVIAIEEEFGIDIPDEVAGQFATVGDLYNYLKKELKSTPPAQCITQRMFYRVRRALVENYDIQKQSVTLDSCLKNLVPEGELKEAWPFLDLFAELEFPKLEKNWWPIGSRLKVDELTLRELLTTMTSLNAEKLLMEPGSDEEVWVRMTKVIERQLNVSVHEIQPDAVFTRDLGMS